jgi:hypothetical protein
LQDALHLPQAITISGAPLSNDAHAPDARAAGVLTAPLPPSTTQQQAPENSRQETQRPKLLLDLLLHRTPNTKVSADNANAVPAQTQSPSPNTQSDSAASHHKTSRELPPHSPPLTQPPRIQRPRDQTPRAPAPPPNPPPKSPPPISPPSTTTSKTAAPASSNSQPPNKTPPTTPPKSAPSPANATPPSPQQRVAPSGSA